MFQFLDLGTGVATVERNSVLTLSIFDMWRTGALPSVPCLQRQGHGTHRLVSLWCQIRCIGAYGILSFLFVEGRSTVWLINSLTALWCSKLRITVSKVASQCPLVLRIPEYLRCGSQRIDRIHPRSVIFDKYQLLSAGLGVGCPLQRPRLGWLMSADSYHPMRGEQLLAAAA